MENPFSLLPIQVEKYYGPRTILIKGLHTIGGPTPASINITGLHGMGKTALLRYLALPSTLESYARLFSPPYDNRPYLIFPIFVEFSVNSNQPIAYLYQRFHDSYRRYYEYVGAFSNTEVSPHDLPEPQQLESTKEGQLNGIYQDMVNLDKLRIRSVFLLDDLDLALPNMEEELDYIRPWRSYASMIVCSGQPLSDINPKASSVFGTFNYDSINGLDNDEAETFLRDPLEKLEPPQSFPGKDIEYLLELAGRHPATLLIGGKQLWEVRKQFGILEKSDIPLDDDQRDLLQKRLEFDLTRTFEKYLDSIKEEEKTVLIRLARGERISPSSPQVSKLNYIGLIIFDERNDAKIFSKLFGNYLLTQGESASIKDEVKLAGYEEKLYRYLKENPTRVCYYEEIWETVWGGTTSQESISPNQKRRQIQVTVSRINKKLRDGSGYEIAGIRGVGYRLMQKSQANKAYGEGAG
ncbi:MAG: winged helix-turn-helix domain-containing protein [Chloroflexota bacterium]